MSQAGTSRRTGRSGYGERRPRNDDMLPGLEDIDARHEGEDGSLVVGTDTAAPKTEEGPTPEEALAEARKTLEDRDAQLAAEAERRRKAEEERDSAVAQRTTEASRAIQHQEEAIAGAVTAAQQKRDAARAKVKSARESGDQDGELSAIDSLTQANAELMLAERNKQGFEAWKKAQGERIQQPRPTVDAEPSAPTREAQEWLGDHPLYFEDTDTGREYRARALAAHSAALAKGVAEGSKAYVDFIDGKLEQAYGKGHGQLGRKEGTQDMTDTRVPRTQRRASSTAAPSSRDSGYEGRISGGDYEFVDRASGARLKLVETTDREGRPVETVQGTIPAQWREFAKINKMTDVAYAVEQLKIRRDMEDGGELSGLNNSTNGVYR